MSNLMIRGVAVDFPHASPYDVQLLYMERVLETLQRSGDRNALLESPTGTGKTLCLLCATLGWRESVSSSALPQYLGGGLGYGPSTAAPALSDPLASVLETGGGGGGGGGGGATSAPKVVFTSRTHSQLANAVRELKKSRYRPRTVLLGSREQLCIHAEVSKERGARQNYLCSALVKSRSCRFHSNVERFVQGSARSKTAMCGGGTTCGGASLEAPDAVMDIEDLRAHGQEHDVCPYYLARHETSLQNAELCLMPYNYVVDPTVRASLQMPWHDAIVIFDEAHNIEGVASAAASFDLQAASIAGSIAEVQRCIDRTLQIREGTADGAWVRGMGAEDGPPGVTEVTPEVLAQLKAMLLGLEESLDRVELAKGPSGILGFTRPGDHIYALLGEWGITPETKSLILDVVDQALDLLQEIETSSRTLHLADVRRALDVAFREGSTPASLARDFCLHVHAPSSGRGGFRGRGGGSGSKRNAAASDFLGGSSGGAGGAGAAGGAGGAGGSGRTLSLWCFNPGVAMQDLCRLGVYAVILTSGTLAPLPSLAQELAMPFPVRLENAHVVAPEQVWVGALQRGVTGKKLNSSFRFRDTPEYKAELGNTIANVARIVPDGLLVFFPSYGTLASAVEAWKASGQWDRITARKHAVVEPRGSSDAFSEVVTEYKTHVESGRGAVFFAVCRGKVSEGIDFPDALGRAVIVTGLPFPPRTDPKVALKRKHLDDLRKGAATSVASAKGNRTPVDRSPGSASLTGEQWYLQQASRAVNQAVGRVIRHRADYGSILLCDERFSWGRQRQTLSSWLRPQVQVSAWTLAPWRGPTQTERVRGILPVAASTSHSPVSPVTSMHGAWVLPPLPPPHSASHDEYGELAAANPRGASVLTPVSTPSRGYARAAVDPRGGACFLHFPACRLAAVSGAQKTCCQQICENFGAASIGLVQFFKGAAGGATCTARSRLAPGISLTGAGRSSISHDACARPQVGHVGPPGAAPSCRVEVAVDPAMANILALYDSNPGPTDGPAHGPSHGPSLGASRKAASSAQALVTMQARGGSLSARGRGASLANVLRMTRAGSAARTAASGQLRQPTFGCRGRGTDAGVGGHCSSSAAETASTVSFAASWVGIGDRPRGTTGTGVAPGVTPAVTARITRTAGAPQSEASSETKSCQGGHPTCTAEPRARGGGANGGARSRPRRPRTGIAVRAAAIAVSAAATARQQGQQGKKGRGTVTGAKGDAGIVLAAEGALSLASGAGSGGGSNGGGGAASASASASAAAAAASASDAVATPPGEAASRKQPSVTAGTMGTTGHPCGKAAGKRSAGAESGRSKGFLGLAKEALGPSEFAVFRSLLKRYKPLKDGRDALTRRHSAAVESGSGPRGGGAASTAASRQDAEVRSIFSAAVDLFEEADYSARAPLEDGFAVYVPRYWKRVYAGVVADARARRPPSTKRARHAGQAGGSCGAVRPPDGTTVWREAGMPAAATDRPAGRQPLGRSVAGQPTTGQQGPRSVAVGTRTRCGACRAVCIAPFEAKCGHIACCSCWQAHIATFPSTTGAKCMVCGHPVKRKTLSKIFF